MLKNEIQVLKNERDDLKLKLDKFNIVKDSEIKLLEAKYQKLIDGKMKIIDDLILKMNVNVITPDNKNNILSSGEKLIAVNFISFDQRINHTIICKNKTEFHEIEKELYIKYPEYTENDNYFTFGDLKINRWKTLEENSIYGYTIMLNKTENK